MMLWMLTGSIATAMVGLLVYIFYLRRGQFDDPEAVKYQLFREENPED